MADLQKEQKGLIVASLVFIAMVAIGVVLLYARSVLIPFVLAVFISLLISPILDFQTLRLKIPRIFAVTITVIIVLIILAVIFLFLNQAIQSVVSTASRYSDSFIKLIELALQKFKTWGLSPNQDEIISTLQNRVPRLITNASGTVFGFISGAFLVSIFVIFCWQVEIHAQSIAGYTLMLNGKFAVTLQPKQSYLQ